MHYDWKNEFSYDGIDSELAWWDEALSSELSYMLDILIVLVVIFWFLYVEPEALSYEIFMWGDIGIVTDVRYYGVAPHWYFRPFMAWLIACPHHKTGIFGLLFFFFFLFFQPVINCTNELNSYNKKKILFFNIKIKRKSYFNQITLNSELNLYFQFFYFLFIIACLYAASFLPYGRFYNRLGGNIGMLSAYMYIFIYLGFPIFRKSIYLESYYYSIYNKTNFLKNN